MLAALHLHAVAGRCWTLLRLWGPIAGRGRGGDAGRPAPGPAAQLPARLVVPRCSTAASTSRPPPTRRLVSGLLRVSAGGAGCLRRPAGPDLVGLHAHADRLHPAAGQGLSAGQRAAARRRLGDAHPGRGRADRGDRPEDAGRQAHGRHLRPVDPAQRQRLQLRRPVPDARRLRAPHAAGRCPATPSPRRCRSASRRKCREAIVNIFGAPPVEGLGTAGGFKIIVQDTGDNGLPALQQAADDVVAAGERRPAPARAVHQLPGRHALAGADHRPRPGQGPRRLDRRRPHDAGIDARPVLHQRLQPLRPHLAGQRPGPRRRSASRSTTSSS